MATETHIQAAALFNDLKPGKELVSWQVGKIANALLEKAKEEQPDNVALAVIDPFVTDREAKYIRGAMMASDVRAVVGQIVTATDSGPSIA